MNLQTSENKDSNPLWTSYLDEPEERKRRGERRGSVLRSTERERVFRRRRRRRDYIMGMKSAPLFEDGAIRFGLGCENYKRLDARKGACLVRC